MHILSERFCLTQCIAAIWSFLNDEMAKMLLKMSCSHVQDRLTAEEAMAHPYFAPVRQAASST